MAAEYPDTLNEVAPTGREPTSVSGSPSPPGIPLQDVAPNIDQGENSLPQPEPRYQVTCHGDGRLHIRRACQQFVPLLTEISVPS